MDASPYLVIGAGSAIFAVIGTLLTVRKGMISTATCEKCGTAKDKTIEAVKTDLSEDISDIKGSVKGIHEKLDEQGQSFRELTGYLKGREERGIGG